MYRLPVDNSLGTSVRNSKWPLRGLTKRQDEAHRGVELVADVRLVLALLVQCCHQDVAVLKTDIAVIGNISL